jgi:hypothetical protein
MARVREQWIAKGRGSPETAQGRAITVGRRLGTRIGRVGFFWRPTCGGAAVALDRIWFINSDARHSTLYGHPNREQAADCGPSNGNASCSCGYGDNCVAIITVSLDPSRLLHRMPNAPIPGSVRLFAYVRYWSGCLSYDVNDAPSDIRYTDSIQDLIDSCADPITRELVQPQLSLWPSSPAGIVNSILIMNFPPPISHLVLSHLCLVADPPGK